LADENHKVLCRGVSCWTSLRRQFHLIAVTTVRLAATAARWSRLHHVPDRRPNHLLSLTVTHYLSIISYYLSRPTTFNIRVEHATEMRFPSVTICNENIVTLSGASSLGKLLAGTINLWSPYGIGQTIYIFMLWFVLSSSFFPRLISAAADWMSAILPHMVWP